MLACPEPSFCCRQPDIPFQCIRIKTARGQAGLIPESLTTQHRKLMANRDRSIMGKVKRHLHLAGGARWCDFLELRICSFVF